MGDRLNNLELFLISWLGLINFSFAIIDFVTHLLAIPSTVKQKVISDQHSDQLWNLGHISSEKKNVNSFNTRSVEYKVFEL